MTEKLVLQAGAAVADITPQSRVFLFGYPHVERYSTGVHDRLLSSALFLDDGRRRAMFIANDIIYVSKEMAGRVRQRIEEEFSIPAGSMMISATHTHSGPMTINLLTNRADTTVPSADPKYVEFFEDRMFQAAAGAILAARPAEAAVVLADGSGVGTNRHDPAGQADPQVPVLSVRQAGGGKFIALMQVCSMHPTVLHEDSTLVSGDFPSMARQYLQRHVVGDDCPVLCQTGPCGDQSPRHVTRANTFDEAVRLGEILGRSIEASLRRAEYTGDCPLSCQSEEFELPPKTPRTVAEAEANLQKARRKLDVLRGKNTERTLVRTAECDWFGAEESLELARAANDGSLAAAVRSCMPAEAQLIRIGKWNFVGWPGEIFVEHALAVKAHSPSTFVVSLANGELQGYIATPRAAAEGWYEAGNCLFAHEGSEILVAKTLEMLARHNGQ